MRNQRNELKIKNAILRNIQNNIREYFIVMIIFLIGLILGVIFINNTNQENKEEITSYIGNFVQGIKTDYTVDNGKLLNKSIINNLILAITLWISGCTVIGMPFVYGIVGFRGFALGYTISSSIIALGTGNGIIFVLSSILLQTIITIPVIFALAVSGIKLYKSIMKDRRKENIKVEIFRHTAFSGAMLIMLLISSGIEAYISSNLLTICSNMI